MLQYTLIFLVLAILAGFPGFGILAGTSAWTAKTGLLILVVLQFLPLPTGNRPPVA